VDRNFCKFTSEPRNAIDVDWRLVDKVVPCSRLEETVWRRAVERATRSDRCVDEMKRLVPHAARNQW
jgi:hypothetical protein